MLQRLSAILDAAWVAQDYRELVQSCPAPLPATLLLPDLLHCLLRKGEAYLQLQDGPAARDLFLDMILLLEKRGRQQRLPQFEIRGLLGLIKANRLSGEAEKALQMIERLQKSAVVSTCSQRFQLQIEKGWGLLAAAPEEAILVASTLTAIEPDHLSATDQLEYLLLKAALLQEEQLTVEALDVISAVRESNVSHRLNRARLAQTRGTLLLQLQRNREAAASLELAIEIFDRYQIYSRLIEMRALKAQALFQSGDRRDATRMLRTTRQRAYELDLPVDRVLAVAEEFNCDANTAPLPFRNLQTTCELPGFSNAIRQVNERIQKMGNSSLPVLILGETGVGKELAAQALHSTHGGSKASMVTIHCPSLSESLFESTLFGHRRGSFTGATSDRQGLVEQAEGGTLFLDEISEISPPIQAKLLRFLETGEYHTVGNNQVKKSDIRILSASNRSYRALLQDHSFRSDLLHRIAGAIIELPPLRERQEDIPLLLEEWLQERNEGAAQCKIISPASVKLLQNYSFPGNIRELRHLFQSAWEQARSNILPEHFAIDCSAEAEVSADDQTFQVGPLRPAVKEFEKSFLEQTLREVRFDKSHASRLLQISRQTLYTKLKQHGLLETGG